MAQSEPYSSPNIHVPNTAAASQSLQPAPSLASLSRNTSVISSSSSSSSTSSLVPPIPPRPIRSFSRSPTPPGGRRARSPPTPAIPLQAYAPIYLTHRLGFSDDTSQPPTGTSTILPHLLQFQGTTTTAEPTGRSATISATITGADTRPQIPRTRTFSATRRVYSPNDFDFGEPLGDGSYSTVLAATYRRTGQAYALKIIDKSHLTRFNKVKYAHVEKDSLARLSTAGHPGVVRLHWAFSDASSLYFVLDLVPNGELVTHISKLGSLSLECSRFYTAEILDAVIWMHGLGVIHRDMKPENVLLDEKMRVKITDFGTAKILSESAPEERATSFVGSPGYISPELLLASGCGKSADFWAIGCIVYHMITGVQPFKALTPYLSMEKTKKAEYTIPPGFDSIAQDLVENFLIVDPNQRLGDAARGGPDPVRAHKFFDSVDWPSIWVLNPPVLEAGLVKKEPRTPRGNLLRSKDPTIVAGDSSDDNSCGLGVGNGGSSRGDAWAALVRDLSEDEMEDERSSAYNHRRADDAHSLDGGSEGTIGDRDSGRKEDRNRNGIGPMRAIFPSRDESFSTERSEHTVRVGGRNESISPSRNELSAQTSSPEGGRYEEANGASAPSQIGAEVRVWDAYYGGRPTPLSGDDDTRHRLSEEIIENRENSGSPVSSTTISSVGQSDGEGVWAHLLQSGEKALFCSAVHLKHRGIFQRPQLKPRLLILTDQGRLLCVKTSVPASVHLEEPHKKGGDAVTPIAKIKSEVLLATAFPSSPTKSSPLSPAPGSRRGSSVGQSSGGSTKRRLSVSTTASRISIRGRSTHRRSVETLMGAEATKGDGTLVIQTAGQWYTYVLDGQAVAVRWRQEIIAAQQRHSFAEPS